MELSQLRYFKAVAEIGKISEAAEALFISAPALSTSISRLERELGTQLFDRTNNKISLNVQGRILLKYVNRIFSELEGAKLELRQSVMQKSRHVSLATVASTQWIDMITAFTEENPHFTLSCTSVKRAEISSVGLAAQYNFLLAASEDVPEFYQAEFDSVLLFRDHPLLMVHRSHPLATKKTVELSELVGENIFLPMRDYPLYDHLINIFDVAGLPFPIGNAYSILALQDMISRGLGVSFITKHTARSPSPDICYIPISNAYRPWESRLFWRKDTKFTEDERTFKEFVERYYGVNSLA